MDYETSSIDRTSTLFGRGVENLLQQEKCLEFLGRVIDVSKVIERVKDLKPDVLIIEKSIVETDLGLTLRYMLRSCDRIRIIELDPEDETICIYSSRRQVIKQVQDLVEIIR